MNVAVVTGASTSLNCSSDGYSNSLRWWHAVPGNVEMNIYLGTRWKSNFTYSEMFTLFNGADNGTLNLNIIAVNESIAGTYTCQEPGEESGSSAELIVLGE